MKRPMNVHVLPRSAAERKYRALAGIEGPEPTALAPGIAPTRAHDLHYHGGKTIPDLSFVNIYLGGNSWQQSDVQAIDKALAGAMAEPTLTNVMAQYFTKPPSCAFLGSQIRPGPSVALMSKGDVEALVGDLSAQGALAGYDLQSTVLNFMLPKGTVLTDNPTPGAARAGPDAMARRGGVPEEEEADSLHGLGGYHGSLPIGEETVYYAVGVYSEMQGGQPNGIPVFDASWKNVVATFYHELNEARTDADVDLVIQGGQTSLLGWTSRQGEECGDFPVFEANPLTLVFQQVPLTNGGTAPVQFQYSNHVHGPEGPIATAYPPYKRHKH